MATLKQTWIDTKGIEHGSEHEANLQDLIYVSEAEVDAWLEQQPEFKKRKEYARILKMWENARIRRSYDFNKTQTIPQERFAEPFRSFIKAKLYDELEDDDLKGATVVRV